jgi:hypothetical protein
MAMFIGGSVNPSALEIAAAILTWTALGTLLVLPRSAAPFVPHAAGLGAVLLATTRALSPLWLVLCVVFLAASSTRSAIRTLSRQRSVRWWGLAVVVVTIGSVVWTAAEKVLQVAPTSAARPGFWTALRVVWDRVPLYWHEMIGILGWLDTQLPGWVINLWWAVIALLMVAGVAAGRWRRGCVLIALGIAVLIVPMVIEARGAATVGYVWQGRYTLPLAVGVPILASMLIQSWRRLSRSAAVAISGGLIGCLAVSQFAALHRALIRFEVGVGALTHGPAWRPPGGSFTVYTLAIVGLAMLVVVAFTARGSATVNADG